MGFNLSPVTRFGMFSRAMPKSEERQCREYTKYDLTVEEKKGLLDTFRDNKVRQALQEEGEVMEQNSK